MASAAAKSSSSAETPSDGRVRRSHTRSRTGCLTCRKRHVRCDEKRPGCAKCLSAGRVCEYPTTLIPLRERRRAKDVAFLPGQQQPWLNNTDQNSLSSSPSSSSSQLSAASPSALLSTSSSSVRRSPAYISWKIEPAAGSVDPFETLPIGMDTNSKRLLHYFHQVGDSLGVSNIDRKEDCIAFATHDQYALRNTLIVAGIHYSWMSGGLRGYRSTFLFHKGETMRMVNNTIRGRLTNPTACAIQVATLCWADCCMGNIPAAEAHLDGFTTLLDLRDQQRDNLCLQDDMEDELLDRYLILIYSIITRVKSMSFLDPSRAKDNPEVVHAQIARWHKEEQLGIHVRLKAMRMFPHFFSQPPRGRRARRVDVMPVINMVRKIVATLVSQQSEDGDEVCGFKSDHVSQLQVAMAEIHKESLSMAPELRSPKQESPDRIAFKQESPEQDIPDSPRQEKLISHFCGVTAATALFMDGILGPANIGTPIDSRLHRRLLIILKKDIDKSVSVLSALSGLDLDLWLWKAFIGAMSLVMRCIQDADRHPGGNGPLWAGKSGALAAMETFYLGYIRKWSQATGISRWEVTKAALLRIAWPASFDKEQIARRIWEHAIRQRGPTASPNVS